MRFCDGEEKTVCKVRGITLNNKTSELVTFDTIKDVVLNGAPPVTVHTDRKIKRRKGKRGCACDHYGETLG